MDQGEKPTEGFDLFLAIMLPVRKVRKYHATRTNTDTLNTISDPLMFPLSGNVNHKVWY